MAAQPVGPILVGIDNVEPSRISLLWAAQEAGRRKVPLEVVHAGYYLYGPVFSLDETMDTELIGDLKRDVATAVRLAQEMAPSVTVVANVHEGDPINYLIEQSTRASMIVLGTHDVGRVSGAILRSISQSVAAHARCPVVAVNHNTVSDAPPKNVVVVGVSPQPGGVAALRLAFEEAELRHASVLAVRSWGNADLGMADMGLGRDFLATWHATEAKLLDDCLAPLVRDHPTIEVQKRLPAEKPEWALQREALGAELLVVGAHRTDDHWFSRLGPVASWLLHRTPCPLAVVGEPHRPERSGSAT